MFWQWIGDRLELLYIHPGTFGTKTEEGINASALTFLLSVSFFLFGFLLSFAHLQAPSFTPSNLPSASATLWTVAMETLMESVEDDEDWLKAAPEATHDDTVLLQRASLALQHPFAASPNENTRLALTNLLKFGLAAEMAVVPGVSTELSHYIADLLNFATTNKKPCPHHFNLRIGDQRYKIPERSRFFFLRLSYVLQSNIFLFSSRAKPVLFQPKENATRTLAFFHSISSYTSISQFLVLTASGHVPCPMEVQQVELSQYTNPISPATFRDAPRKIQARGREDDSALTGPVLKRALARAL
jgi:hypothetical protein